MANLPDPLAFKCRPAFPRHCLSMLTLSMVSFMHVLIYNLTWFSATKHSSYCDKCNCIICEECRSVRDPGDGDVIYCRDCVEEKED